MRVTFDEIVDALIHQREYVKGLEERLKRTERERDSYRDECDPEWRKREFLSALDFEASIRQ